MEEISTGAEILNSLLSELNITVYELAKNAGYDREQAFYDVQNGKTKKISSTMAKKIVDAYPDVRLEYLYTGSGSMLKSDIPAPSSNRRLIPLYNDVAAIGERLAVADSNTPHSAPSEYIDTGDWFTDATAAIRHYEESMIEYPSGCILAIREILNFNLVVYGRDYVIETDENRMTKRIQKGYDNEHYTLYSTNPETYPDGRLVHESFDIHKQDIRCIFLVLGYVVKKNGGTIVFSGKK
jgi:hypothetical protein